MGIPFRYAFFSEADYTLPPILAPGEWALQIARQLGASEYVNPPGGEELFDPAAFAEAGIRLTISRLPSMAYGCRGLEFQPDLSIIDVLMWNAPEDVLTHMRNATAG
jgi:hypothetical protein